LAAAHGALKQPLCNPSIQLMRDLLTVDSFYKAIIYLTQHGWGGIDDAA
jgi:hypothetical protein